MWTAGIVPPGRERDRIILDVTGPLARLPRSLFWLGGAYLVVVAVVATGLHRSLDRSVAAVLWQDVPCWGRVVSERVSILFAAELSLLYAVAMGFVCLRSRRLWAAGWIVFVLFAGIGVEITFKYYFVQPAPSAFLETLRRMPCAQAGLAYPLTSVATPSTLPSGYSIRAAYFCLLLAAMIGARWPRLRWPAWLGLGALALVTAASRVTVGWHWPTDVVAGVLLGACAAVLVLSQADGFRWLGARGGTRPRSGSASRSRARVGAASGGRGSASRPSARQSRR